MRLELGLLLVLVLLTRLVLAWKKRLLSLPNPS
jgi:hypothetical protein